jgi:hypothetical protein
MFKSSKRIPMQTHASSTYLLLLLVIGHVWVVSGCGGDAGEIPIHHHVVCGSRADGQTESCASPERESRSLIAG